MSTPGVHRTATPSLALASSSVQWQVARPVIHRCSVPCVAAMWTPPCTAGPPDQSLSRAKPADPSFFSITAAWVPLVISHLACTTEPPPRNLRADHNGPPPRRGLAGHKVWAHTFLDRLNTTSYRAKCPVSLSSRALNHRSESVAVESHQSRRSAPVTWSRTFGRVHGSRSGEKPGEQGIRWTGIPHRGWVFTAGSRHRVGRRVFALNRGNRSIVLFAFHRASCRAVWIWD